MSVAPQDLAAAQTSDAFSTPTVVPLGVSGAGVVELVDQELDAIGGAARA